MRYKIVMFLKYTMLCLFGLCWSLPLFSQSEIVVKTSDKYYWAQVVGDTEDHAKKESRTELIFQITLDIGKQNNLNLQSDIFIHSIKYLIFPRGPKVRAVAYVLKDQVSNIQAGHKLDMIELHYTEANSPEIAKSEESNNIEPEVDEQHSDNKKKVSELMNESGSEETITNKVPEKIMEKIIVEDAKPALVKTEKTMSPVGYNFDDKNDLVNFLVKTNNIADIADIMKKQKYKGMLNYGKFNSSTLYPERCFLLVFDPSNGNIKALLNKGSTGKRHDLLTDKDVDGFQQLYNNMNIVWIQIY